MFIEYKGQNYEVRYTFNGLCELEEKAGLSVTNIMTVDAGFREMRLLLWAGLISSDRKITVDFAGELIQAEVDRGIEFSAVMENIVKELHKSGVLGTKDMDNVGEK